MKHFPIPSDIPAPAVGTYKRIMRLMPSCNGVVIVKAGNVAQMLVTVRNGVGSHIERDLIARELRKLGLTPEQVCPDVNLT